MSRSSLDSRLGCDASALRQWGARIGDRAKLGDESVVVWGVSPHGVIVDRFKGHPPMLTVSPDELMWEGEGR